MRCWVAACPLADAPKECGGVLPRLGFQGFRQIFASTADRRCRTDVGSGRHGSDVPRRGDERAGGGGLRAAWGHVHDDREYGLANISSTMSRVESSRPPGVSIVMTTISALSASAALLRARETYRAVTGSIVPSISTRAA